MKRELAHSFQFSIIYALNWYQMARRWQVIDISRSLRCKLSIHFNCRCQIVSIDWKLTLELSVFWRAFFHAISWHFRLLSPKFINRKKINEVLERKRVYDKISYLEASLWQLLDNDNIFPFNCVIKVYLLKSSIRSWTREKKCARKRPKTSVLSFKVNLTFHSIRCRQREPRAHNW